MPSFEVTVITAVPTPTAVTTPFEETVATFLSEDFQLTFLFDADVGLTVATRVFFFPASSEILVDSSETDETS